MLETNCAYVNLSPHGEPQLGRRGLYRASGGAVARPQEEAALLWVLNLSDGSRTLLDIATRSGLPYDTVRRAARRLKEAGLLGDASARRGGHRWASSAVGAIQDAAHPARARGVGHRWIAAERCSRAALRIPCRNMPSAARRW